MGDERVGSGRFHHNIEGRGTARPDYIGLDTLQVVGGIAALIDVVPDLADGMEGRKFVWSGVDEIDTDTFARLGIELPSAGHERMVLEDAAVEKHAVEFAIEHGLYIV